MKKPSTVIICILCAVLITLSALLPVSAKEIQDEAMLTYVGKIPYGEAELDCKKDEAYGDVVTIDSYAYDLNYGEEEKTKVNAWLLWNEYGFYGYVEVTDFTPVTYKTESYKTDCLQLYFTLLDREKKPGRDDFVASNPDDISAGMFRLMTPVATDKLSPMTYSPVYSPGGLWLDAKAAGESKYIVKENGTEGCIFEFFVQTPRPIVSGVNRAGHRIGFGFQYNDDTDNDNGRNATVFSTNSDKLGYGKTGAFILLTEKGEIPAKEAEWEGTAAPEATVAPVTVAEPAVTTAAPGTVTTAAPSGGDTVPPVSGTAEAPQGGETAAPPAESGTAAPSATETAGAAEETTAGEQSGCGSSATALLSVLICAAAAFAARRRKK